MLGPRCGTQDNLSCLHWECRVLALDPQGSPLFLLFPTLLIFSFFFLILSLLSLTFPFFYFLLFSLSYSFLDILSPPHPPFLLPKANSLPNMGEWPGLGPGHTLVAWVVPSPMDLGSEPLEAQGTSCLYLLFCPSLQESRARGNSWKMWQLGRGECGSIAKNWTWVPCGEKLSTGL